MSVLLPKKLMSNTMSLLKEWPPADDALPLHQSHLIVTFGPPISQEFRSSRMQEHFERMTSLEGWSIYTPDRCADEVRDDCGVYGALFSSSDMYIFDELLNQLRAIERENAFLSENDLPFSSLFITDFRDLSRGGKVFQRRRRCNPFLFTENQK